MHENSDSRCVPTSDSLVLPFCFWTLGGLASAGVLPEFPPRAAPPASGVGATRGGP